MKNLTELQKVVVESRIKDGYVVIGNFQNMSGVGESDVGIVKGVHRMHINALGYDSYVKGAIYKEVE